MGQIVPKIPVLTFDQWVERAGLVQPKPGEWIAKIDVEGFELRVLAGMNDALRKGAFRLLVVELNEFTLALTGSAPKLLREFLRDRGYAELRTTGDAGRRKLARTCNGFFVPMP